MEFERDEMHLAHKYYEREDSVMLTIWDHQTMSLFEQTYTPKKKKNLHSVQAMVHSKIKMNNQKQFLSIEI